MLIYIPFRKKFSILSPFTKQLLETKEYDEILGHMALQRVSLDLDDGVFVNYQKFQNIEVISGGRTIKKNLLVEIYKGK